MIPENWWLIQIQYRDFERKVRKVDQQVWYLPILSVRQKGDVDLTLETISMINYSVLCEYFDHRNYPLLHVLHWWALEKLLIFDAMWRWSISQVISIIATSNLLKLFILAYLRQLLFFFIFQFQVRNEETIHDWYNKFDIIYQCP